MTTRRNRIRRLLPGEPLPDGTPRRYTSRKDGYVVLRWKVGPREYVEVFEHRLVAGMSKPHVHHINGDRADNRPENLKPVTPLEHRAEHSKVNVQEAIDLYDAGWSIVALGRRYGCANSNIHHILKSRGVARRQPGDSRVLRIPVDEVRLRSLVAAGCGTRTIAAKLGTTRIVIKNRMARLGLATRRPGNYTVDERAALRSVES